MYQNWNQNASETKWINLIRIKSYDTVFSLKCNWIAICLYISPYILHTTNGIDDK